jgi:hypothetical protein
MATTNAAYVMFEETMKRVIEHLEMDGKASIHHDFRNYLIGVLLRFNHKYLCVKDIINFVPTTERKIIMDETVKHIREIKKQFHAYFHAIWC